MRIKKAQKKKNMLKPMEKRICTERATSYMTVRAASYMTVRAASHAAARAVLCAVLAVALIAQTVCGAFALPDKIWETSEESIITRGVTLSQARRFTEDGWLSMDIARVDLSDKYLSLNALYDSGATHNLSTVKSLAENSGSILAVNGGFFDWTTETSGEPVGAVMKDGQVDVAFGELNAYGDVMGSLTINKLNEALFGYIKVNITLWCGDSDGTASAGSGAAAGEGVAASSSDSESPDGAKSRVAARIAARAASKSTSAASISTAAGDTSAGKVMARLTAGAYNRASFYDYKDVTIIDRKWRKTSIGVSESRPDIVEMVVAGGKIKELRVAQPSVEIPEDGFVVVTRVGEDGTHVFSGADFAVGKSAYFDVELTPALEDAVMHLEGASMLIIDGVIPEKFSYDVGIADKNPRTMVGVTEDGKEMIIVTVDGRQASSMGLTSYQSAELMYELGAYNALNFDGGGSTQMVARVPGTNALSIVNGVTEKSARKVSNGLGVFTSAPRAAVKGAIIETIDPNVFVGTHRKFTVKAFDRFNNPVELSPGDVKWSVVGIEGDIVDGLLVPKTAGDGYVRAKVGRSVTRFDIKALDQPQEIILNATSLSTKPGESHTFTVTVRDSLGFSAKVNPADISWDISNAFGNVIDGVFTRDNNNPGYITAALGSAAAYCAVLPLAESKDGSKADSTPAKPVEMPKSTKVSDGLNRQEELSNGGAASFRFGVLGDGPVPTPSASASKAEMSETSANAAMAKKAVSDAFVGTVNKALGFGLFLGAGAHDGVTGVSDGGKHAYATDGHFEMYNSLSGDESRALIKLSSLGSSIRKAGKGQWGLFLDALNGFEGKDLFIMLHQAPSTFDDKLEAALFKQLLAEKTREAGCRVWVFFNGPSDYVWLEDGVRYFSLAGAASPAADAKTGAGARYLEVTVNGDTVTYMNKKF